MRGWEAVCIVVSLVLLDCPQEQIHYASTQTARLKKHSLFACRTYVCRQWTKLGASGCSFFYHDVVMSFGSILYCRQSWETCFLPPQPIFLEQFIGPVSGDHEAFPWVPAPFCIKRYVFWVRKEGMYLFIKDDPHTKYYIFLNHHLK